MIAVLVCRLKGKDWLIVMKSEWASVSKIAIVVMRYDTVGKQSYWHSGLVMKIKLEFVMNATIQMNVNKRVMILVLKFDMVDLIYNRWGIEMVVAMNVSSRERNL